MGACKEKDARGSASAKRRRKDETHVGLEGSRSSVRSRDVESSMQDSRAVESENERGGESDGLDFQGGDRTRREETLTQYRS